MHREDHPRVLIADDDADACETLADVLISEGFIVETVEDGAGALEAARTARFDFAFLDQRMPGPEGLEVATALRQSNACRRIFLLTAYAEPAFVDSCACPRRRPRLCEAPRYRGRPANTQRRSSESPTSQARRRSALHCVSRGRPNAARGPGPRPDRSRQTQSGDCCGARTEPPHRGATRRQRYLRNWAFPVAPRPPPSPSATV